MNVEDRYPCEKCGRSLHAWSDLYGCCGDSAKAHNCNVTEIKIAPPPPEDLNLQELHMEGVKHDGGKPRIGLIHKAFLWALATTLTKGAEKYAAYNWLGGMDWNRPYDATLRHLTAWWDGESLDQESGDSHLWHAAAEIMFLVVYEALGLGKDTRYQREPTKGEMKIDGRKPIEFGNIRNIRG